MKLKHSLRDLRNTQDMELLDQIENDYPPNWDTGQLFERSYQHYLERCSKENCSDISSKQKRIGIYRTVGLAACLLVTVGMGLGIWSRQQRVESRPVSETTTTATIENTVQPTSEMQSNESESVRIIETTTSNAEMSERETSSVTSSGKAPSFQNAMSTAKNKYSETEPSTAVNVGTNPVTVSSTTITVGRNSMTVPTTGVTVCRNPVTVPTTVVNTAPETSVFMTTDMNISTEPTTVATETEIIPTEPNEINPTEPNSTATDLSEVTTLDDSLLPWFVIEQIGDYTQIRSVQEVEPSPEEWVTYTIDSDTIAMTEVRKHSSVCEYRIIAADTTEQLTVYQYERTVFIRDWNLSLIPEVVLIGENHGVLWTDAENSKCGLLWDDGKYTFVIEEAYDRKKMLVPLAQALTPNS